MKTALILQSNGSTLQARLSNLSGVTKLRVSTAYIHVETVAFLTRRSAIPKVVLFDYDARFLTEGLLTSMLSVPSCELFMADIAPLFHPKIYILDTADSMHFIVGSNNATRGGLENNVEVAIHHELDKTADASLVEEVNKLWAALQAIANVRLTRMLIASRRAELAARLPAGKKNAHAKRNPVSSEVRPFDGLLQVLFAEIPRGSGRWNQANFDKDNFMNFFQAGSGSVVKLWQVEPRGHIASAPEERPGVSVKSRNFRIELAAAAGKSYPATGRPIGVFVRIGSRKFHYMLLMPGDTGHRFASEVLKKHAISPPGRMRRFILDLATAMSEWPQAPLWANLASPP
jgi:hypothetical protein